MYNRGMARALARLLVGITTYGALVGAAVTIGVLADDGNAGFVAFFALLGVRVVGELLARVGYEVRPRRGNLTWGDEAADGTVSSSSEWSDGD